MSYVRVVRESGGLGDSLRVIAVAQGLQQKYPEARVHYYGPYYLQNLIAPRIDYLYIPCPMQRRDRERPLDERVYPHLARGIAYQDSVDCWCWAYLHEPHTHGICCQDRIELWCEHGNVEPSRPRLFYLDEDLFWRDKYRSRHPKLIGIQVGATCRSREWPFSYWSKLCELFRIEGFHVILFDVCERWRGQINTDSIEKSIGRPWPETIGKLAACNLIITPDSGFYHLAGVFKLPTLGIFGCTSGQIISRPWTWEDNTHHYIQLEHSQIDYDRLPKAKDSKSRQPCQPICYMRWERGWCASRYREKIMYCSLMEQLKPITVFNRALQIIYSQETSTNGA